MRSSGQCLQHLTTGDERVEVLIADEVVVHVDLTRTKADGWWPRPGEQVWMTFSQLGDGTLTHRRGASQKRSGGRGNGRVCGNIGHIAAYGTRRHDPASKRPS